MRHHAYEVPLAYETIKIASALKARIVFTIYAAERPKTVKRPRNKVEADAGHGQAPFNSLVRRLTENHRLKGGGFLFRLKTAEDETQHSAKFLSEFRLTKQPRTPTGQYIIPPVQPNNAEAKWFS